MQHSSSPMFPPPIFPPLKELCLHEVIVMVNHCQDGGLVYPHNNAIPKYNIYTFLSAASFTVMKVQ